MVPARRFPQQFSGCCKVKLVLYPRAVGLNGLQVDIQGRRNLAAGEPLAQKVEDLQLAVAQAGQYGFAANAAGHAYCVNFEAGAAVYADTHPDQATRSGDALLIEVLRGDNSVLARHIHEPGAWTGKMAFVAATFEYKGDGSGDIRLRIGPSGTLTSGRFQGAIDNVIVRELK